MFDKKLLQGIRFKFLCIISGILFISSLCISTIISLNEKVLLENSLVTKGLSFASYIGKLSQDPLVMKDRIELDSIVSEANNDEDIIYAVILDVQGNPITSQYASINYQSPRVAEIMRDLSKDIELPHIITAIKKRLSIIEQSTPIQTGPDNIGKIDFIFFIG